MFLVKICGAKVLYSCHSKRKKIYFIQFMYEYDIFKCEIHDKTYLLIEEYLFCQNI